jgi:hypothetical protein
MIIDTKSFAPATPGPTWGCLRLRLRPQIRDGNAADASPNIDFSSFIEINKELERHRWGHVRTMHLPLSTAAALAALVAAGSASHIHRQTGDISCTPLPGANGTLELVILPPSTESVPLGIDQDMLQSVSPDNQQEFIFQNCTSNFMGETPMIGDNFTIYYG